MSGETWRVVARSSGNSNRRGSHRDAPPGDIGVVERSRRLSARIVRCVLAAAVTATPAVAFSTTILLADDFERAKRVVIATPTGAWARRLNAAGIHALLVDAFSTRDPYHPPAQARQSYCNDRDAVVAIGATCAARAGHSNDAGGANVTLRTFDHVGHSFDGVACDERIDGALLSPWSEKRYTCTGAYDGVPFDLYDYRVAIESRRYALCALVARFGMDDASCEVPPAPP